MTNAQVSTDSGGPEPADSANTTEDRAAASAQQVLRPTFTVRLGSARTNRSITYGGVRVRIQRQVVSDATARAKPDKLRL
jgi:hypothetical protein